MDETDFPTREQLLDALSWAIHFGTNIPRGVAYDECMKPIVEFYWKAKEAIKKPA